ncbi:hypothetical protein C8R47DRAFT_1116731 [Mycena vitilis]|nr:hypothetical protein C8R47DRAFT_1116731 [Mycena vitilis]
MSKAPVKTLYTAKFYEPASSSESGASSFKPQPSVYVEKLFKTHVALNHMEEVPDSRPNLPDRAHNERVETLRKRVLDAFHAANGNPSNGKWSLLANLLQTGTAKGKYRYINTRTDAVPPQPGPEGWLLAETEEEWLAWEQKRKQEQRSVQDKKREDDELLKEKVETWKRDIEVEVPESPDDVLDFSSSPAKPPDGTKPSSKSHARSIGDLPEDFIPPSFPSDLKTSTPHTVARRKASPIELVPSSSPLSSPTKSVGLRRPTFPNHKVPALPLRLSSADEVPSSSPLSSPPKNSRVYGRPRASESPLKRARSSSPTPLKAVKKPRTVLPLAVGQASGSTPAVSSASVKPLFQAPSTPPRNTLPKLEDLIAASAQKSKAKAKERERGKGKINGKHRVHDAKPRSKTPVKSPSSEERLEAGIDVMGDAVINWDATLERMSANHDGDVSPTKSLSSINESNSLESQNSMDLPNFSHGEPFDPQGGSTQPMGRLEAGESLGTTERGGRGFGQPVDFGFPMRYESQMDVESNLQGVEDFLDADVHVGGYTGPWMPAGMDEDEQWGGQIDSSP